MMKLVFERAGRTITVGPSLPYWLDKATGLGVLDCDVESEKATDQDGEVYKGSTANKRNIVIDGTVILPEGKTQAEIREEFFAFFIPREQGTLYVYEGAAAKKIEYRLENIEIDTDGIFREFTISLVCLDPKFKALEDESDTIAQTMGLIEWPLELPEEFEVGRRTDVLMATVVNNSSVTRGLTLTFMASGEVVNPGMIEVTRQQSLKIITTMHAGDVIIVTTGTGKKRVKLIREGIETNINNLWEFGGTWLQVEPGENVFRATADSSVAPLEVTIASTPAFWGA